MRFNRRDANEREIVDALERAGCLVDRVERRPYDLVVGRIGSVFLLECKVRGARMRDSQKRFSALWGWLGVYKVVRTPEEALRAVGL